MKYSHDVSAKMNSLQSRLCMPMLMRSANMLRATAMAVAFNTPAA